MSQVWFGASCPACGLTRSFVSLAHGDWIAAARYHRLGWLLMFMAAVQVPYRLAILAGRQQLLLSAPAGRWIGRFLIALLIGNWVLGIIFR
jgi:hypothetical protein